MQLKPIKTKEDYEAYLKSVDDLFERKVKPNTPEGQTLQEALLLIKQYEDQHYEIVGADDSVS